MHISITGKLGSGKSTVCKYLQENYNKEIYSVGKIQRELAQKLGVTILELNKLQQTDKYYDDIIDKEMVKISKDKKDLIFDSRVAFKLVVNSYKVYTTIDSIVAAERVLQNTERGIVEKYTSIDDAIQKLSNREQVEIEKFKVLYNVDISDLTNYDLIIDTTNLTPKEIGEVIMQNSGNVSFNSNKIILSPMSLYPTDKVNHLDMKVVNKYLQELKQGRLLAPIEVVFMEGNYYIVDGHHRFVAYLMNKERLLKCVLANKANKLTHKYTLREELGYVGISTLYDYEDIGNFRYKSYPKFYK